VALRVVEGENVTPSHWRIAAGAWTLAACLVLTAGAAAAFADSGPDTKDTDRSPTTNHATAAAGGHTQSTGSATAAHVMPSSTGNGPNDLGQGRTHPDQANQPNQATTATVGPRRKLAAAVVDDPSSTSDANPTNEPAASTDPSPPTNSTAIATAATLAPPTPDQEPATDAPATATLDSAAPATPLNDPATSTATPTASSPDPSSSPTTAASGPPAAVDPTTDQSVPTLEPTASPPTVTEVSQDVVPPTVTAAEPTPQPTETAEPVAPTVVEAQPAAVAARSRSGPNNLSPMQIFRLMTGGSWFFPAGNATGVSSSREFAVPSLLSASPFGLGDLTALARPSSSATAAQVAAGAASALPEDLRIFFHSYGQLVIAASLSAVAAAALPGLAGMVIPALAGMRIGYRQAKAARNVRASGIARFAGFGPIGIVRSGSVVALRSTRSRIARSNAGDQSERVA
jgi:hypothetical protein